jgi:predicted component of type VI protein secretion system
VRAIGRDLRPAGGAPSPEVKPDTRGHLILVSGALNGLASNASFPLLPDSVIGRSADCQVSLPSSLVSTQHARLRLDGGTWFLSDLRSTNGTSLNRRPVSREQRVEYGDLIQVGDVQLRLAP